MNDNRITLRELEERDAAQIVRWRNSDAVRRNLFTQTLLTEEQHLQYFRSVVLTGRCRQYVIVMDGTPPLDIGSVFLKNIDPEKKQAEFGIFIGEAQGRGKKLSGQATDAVLRIAFEELRLDRVCLSVVADNLPAIKTYLRAGFQETSREAGAFPRGAACVDVIHMDISKQQWEKAHYGKTQNHSL